MSPIVTHTGVADPTAVVPSSAVSTQEILHTQSAGTKFVAGLHPVSRVIESIKPEVNKPLVNVAVAPHIPSTSPVGGALVPSIPPNLSKTSSKSKKKKSQVTVTMATAATAQSSAQGSQGENTGRWTAEEHRLFLQGLEQHGKGWKKIASLIKSRTVVQIRTHAQKYFQKLAKARQNGEEGDVAMEGRGGSAAMPSVSASTAQSNKRRRQTSGTKRKAIQSVVSSAQRQGKKIASRAGQGVPNPAAPLPAVAPALSPYVLPSTNSSLVDAGVTQSCVPSITTAQGTISGPALEDSLYVFIFPFSFHTCFSIFLIIPFHLFFKISISHSSTSGAYRNPS
jgi:SHAQKYF class myb-like DNA-binding protein